ncbi:Cache domain containing protein [Pseudomonas sp. GM21]|uniref:cache domain-containing protein n=1 Tax=Pseudomonas sp. GM21 TaxID=1144325 RepID=UPI0002725909|nr:cache domain-containing protein [Pseudomonas sp. GM21]EJM22913.1 Cache domain containing protein [Pseudomonas sp. GM21]
MRVSRLGGFGLFVIQALSLLAHAETSGDDSLQAKRLLQSAVEYYRVQGDAAFAAFSRQGEFIDGERYVFVVDTNGIMQASGGASAVLIGRNVSKALEPELQKAFASALKIPEGVAKKAEYRWMNALDGKVELKQVYYQRVGERILAVGHYLPRASKQQAQMLLDHAVAKLKEDPAATIAAINNLSAEFRQDDLYLFIVDVSTHRYVAHGYNSRLIGVDFATIKDPNGRAVGRPILEKMAKQASASYDYRWKNPVTSKVEEKYALVRKSDNYLVAVGYYKKPH